MDPTDITAYSQAVGTALDTVEKHPAIVKSCVAILIAFGVPAIGPRDKPWIQKRDGLVLPLVRLGFKWVEAYAERTGVFKALEAEVKAFKESLTADRARLGEVEKVVSWQTQVLMAIASALKIDVLTLLRRHESDAPVSSTAVSAISNVSVPKNPVPDVLGKQPEQGSKDAPTSSRLPLDTLTSSM